MSRSTSSSPALAPTSRKVEIGKRTGRPRRCLASRMPAPKRSTLARKAEWLRHHVESSRNSKHRRRRPSAERSSPPTTISSLRVHACLDALRELIPVDRARRRRDGTAGVTSAAPHRPRAPRHRSCTPVRRAARRRAERSAASPAGAAGTGARGATRRSRRRGRRRGGSFRREWKKNFGEFERCRPTRPTSAGSFPAASPLQSVRRATIRRLHALADADDSSPILKRPIRAMVIRETAHLVAALLKKEAASNRRADARRRTTASVARALRWAGADRDVSMQDMARPPRRSPGQRATTRS